MRIKLRERKHKKYTSLYLDIYIDARNRKKQLIKGLQLINNPKTSIEKDANKETIKKANRILRQFQDQYENEILGLPSPKPNADLLDYMQDLIQSKYKAGGYIDKLNSVFQILKRYCNNKPILFSTVNETFITNFRDYLQKKAVKKDGNPLRKNTAAVYFRRFKSVIQQAYRDGIILKNPVENVNGIKEVKTERSFLELSELKKIIHSNSWQNNVVRRAFIFACYSGLRFSDLKSLKWDQIKHSDEKGYYINFEHKKTKQFEKLYIADHTFKILGKKQKDNEVFVGLSKYDCPKIPGWIKGLNIDKHVTFHSSRHTNATLLLEAGADLYTVMKVLGHQDIKTTQIYLHALDSKLLEAASKIPNLFNYGY